LFQQLLQARPRDVALRLELANNALRANAVDTAASLLEEVLRIAPGHAGAAQALRELRSRGKR
jgi:predicted TPR repeat methyltransferase